MKWKLYSGVLIVLLIVWVAAYAQGGGTVNLNSDELEFDRITRAATVIDYSHHKVHAGDFFSASFDTSLGNNDTLFVLMTTPNTTKWSHMLVEANGIFVTETRLYENPTGSGAGASMTAYNHDRNSATTAGLTLKKDYVGTAFGTLLHRDKGGFTIGQSRGSIQQRSNDEWILKQNEDYLLIIVSSTESNLVQVRLLWYEHTSRS
jgi:hypothetical protein